MSYGPYYGEQPAPQPQAPLIGGSAADSPDHLRKEVDIRLQAVTRLRHMNLLHATHAWNRRHDDPIAPYGLAFLFVQPGDPPFYVVSAATKLWLKGPETEDLPRLLFELNQLVTTKFVEPEFDLRRDLANREDPGMNEDAWYVGLGLSSLDTSTGTWDQVSRSVSRSGDIPGVARIVMIDGTIIVCDRRGLNEFNSLKMKATLPLVASRIESLYPWSFAYADELRVDPDHANVLPWLEELNLNLWRLDNMRLDRLGRRGLGGLGAQ
jgi:hypothetical protein